MRITDTLIAQHVVFGRLFDHIESALPRLRTLAEVRLLGGLVEHLLAHHGAQESELAYAALDHALAEKGQMDQMHQDHHEIDARLRHVQTATALPEAKELLQQALQSSRAHFRYEEEIVFPLLEAVLPEAMLEELGQATAQ